MRSAEDWMDLYREEQQVSRELRQEITDLRQKLALAKEMLMAACIGAFRHEGLRD